MKFLQVHLSLSRGGANVACENIEAGLHRIGHQCRTLREAAPIAPLNPDHVLFHSFVSVTSDAYLSVLDEVRDLGIPSSVLIHDYWPICDQTNLVDRNRGWEPCSSPCGGSCVPRKIGPLEELKSRVMGMNLVCFSESSADIMRKAGAEGVTVINHGVDTDAFRPITEQTERADILFCNAWGAKAIKGYKHWEWIREKIPNSTIEATGDTHHENMPSFFSSGDAMLFLSLWPETFGLVVIEAMACGKPVISYPTGIAQEIIANGENGYLTETTNPLEIVERVAEFSALSPSSREDMAEEARACIERGFSLEIMA